MSKKDLKKAVYRLRELEARAGGDRAGDRHAEGRHQSGDDCAERNGNAGGRFSHPLGERAKLPI